MKRVIIISLLSLVAVSAFAQVDRREVRAGNRKFKSDNFKNAEIDYRKALVKDSTSFAANYNLANAMYKQGDYQAAGQSLGKLKDAADVSADADRYYYNLGDVALQSKDYGAAVEAFKQSLLRNPNDIDAKENYIYAKLMLQNQQNQQNQDQQNQDQNQDQQNQDQQNQNKDQEKNQDKNQPQQQPDQQQQNQQQPQQQPQAQQKISQQQAQQMLKAIQAKEKETQDKVDKEKAAALKSKEKEKNW